MIIELLDEIMTCFANVIDEIQNSNQIEISPPVCLEDDEAELLPLFENDFNIDYLDEIPF